MSSCSWAEMVQLPMQMLQNMDISPFDPVRVIPHQSRKSCMILQAFPLSKSRNALVEESRNIIKLHPNVEEFLVHASKAGNDVEQSLDHDGNNMAIIEYARQSYSNYLEVSIESIICRLEKIQNEDICSMVKVDNDAHLKIELQFLYSTNEEYDRIFNEIHENLESNKKLAIMHNYIREKIEDFLQFKTLEETAVVAIYLPFLPKYSCQGRDDLALFHIRGLVYMENGKECFSKYKIFNLGLSGNYSMEFVKEKIDVSDEMKTSRLAKSVSTTSKFIHIQSYAGYKELAKEILDIASMTVNSASPSALLLQGCSGVGKTRLANHVCLDLVGSASSSSYILSSKEIILQASSSLELSFLKRFIARYLLYSKALERYILIIDDLELLFDDDGDESSIDEEKRVARHSVLGFLDDLILRQKDEKGLTPFILGICSNEASNLASELTKVGRFEKTLFMPPPSEKQRLEILAEMFVTLPLETDNHGTKSELCRSWAISLSKHLSGCVAADMKRLCVDALTKAKARSISDTEQKLVRWIDIREAARYCVPSQLSQLDVTLARDIDEAPQLAHSPDAFRSQFLAFWDKRFGGHHEMKKKIYRTIVWPWNRTNLQSVSQNPREPTDLEKSVPPPSGVLFHGLSGTGKTYAAECLAGSLGLNVIRVRASDILDQWLGGSEAALRAIFARARAASPCFLFFDELDAIAMNRENDEDSANDVHSRLLSTLLNLMDGVDTTSTETSKILIVGTTNRLGSIDAALLRPGRFEEHILIDLPNMKDILDMMNIFLKKVPLSPSLDLSETAELLEELGASAADVRGLCSDACMHAIESANVLSDNAVDIHLNSEDFDAVIRRWKE